MCLYIIQIESAFNIMTMKKDEIPRASHVCSNKRSRKKIILRIEKDEKKESTI